MKYFLLLLTFSFALPSFAEFKNPDEAVQKLKSYRSSDFADDAEKEKREETTKETELYDDLFDAVKFTETHAPDDEFLKALVGAASLALKEDPSWYAGEVVAPVYKKNKKAFDKALKSLPPQDAADIKEAIQNSEREKKSGNG